jgi:hypothetical protein
MPIERRNLLYRSTATRTAVEIPRFTIEIRCSVFDEEGPARREVSSRKVRAVIQNSSWISAWLGADSA